MRNGVLDGREFPMATCPICSHSASHAGNPAGGGGVQCKVCGSFTYTDVAGELRKVRGDPVRAAKLAAFIREENVRKVSPTFSSMPGRFPEQATIAEAESRYPDDPLERMKRIAVTIFFLQGRRDKDAEFVPGRDHPLCFAGDNKEMAEAIAGMADRGIIEIREERFEHTLVRLTPAWWSAIEKAFASMRDKRGAISFRPPK
jgi:hypothetical protein